MSFPLWCYITLECILFNNQNQTAFHWSYCFVDCVYRENYYILRNIFIELLQVVPLFDLFLQNLFFLSCLKTK